MTSRMGLYPTTPCGGSTATWNVEGGALHGGKSDGESSQAPGIAVALLIRPLVSTAYPGLQRARQIHS